MSFDTAYARTLAHELGWYAGDDPRDPNPTLNGVTQRAYDDKRDAWKKPRQGVRNMVPEEQRAIYHDYWLAAGCDKLSEPLASAHFDFYFNTNPHNANKALADCGGDVCEYLNLRERFYVNLSEESVKLRRNFNGWENRVQAERKAAGCYVPQ